MTVFVEHRAKCIRKLGALMHQPLARPKQHRPRLLLFALRRHEPRFVALRRDDNRFGIGSVILSDPFIDPLIVNRGLVRSIANQAGAPVIGQMVPNSPLFSGWPCDLNGMSSVLRYAARWRGHGRAYASSAIYVHRIARACRPANAACDTRSAPSSMWSSSPRWSDCWPLPARSSPMSMRCRRHSPTLRSAPRRRSHSCSRSTWHGRAS